MDNVKIRKINCFYTFQTWGIDEKVLSIINNTFNSNDNATINGGRATNYSPSFNPIDKVAELYERLLKAEQEKVAFLEQLLNKKE
ncbi:hypothetical protein [Flavobacterium sp. NKUCC04_CG]|uniref:hypothetical protein n=1 Tax=Flavobacterium sp. NKUCC04_CG TaxID=2842121 RepID=UPI001C5B2C8B|nr:hypothetical protein [Flavobacterium sp. NKUCC04_CG]MBW3517557.1 hypothetical protein [Flavobacterium sp. NKUCC04_CG]